MGDHQEASEFVECTVLDHRRVYAAIAAHRAGEAQRAMDAHFRHVERDMLRRLANEESKFLESSGEVG